MKAYILVPTFPPGIITMHVSRASESKASHLRSNPMTPNKSKTKKSSFWLITIFACRSKTSWELLNSAFPSLGTNSAGAGTALSIGLQSKQTPTRPRNQTKERGNAGHAGSVHGTWRKSSNPFSPGSSLSVFTWNIFGPHPD